VGPHGFVKNPHCFYDRFKQCLSNEVSGWAVLEVFFCVHPGSATISPHGLFPANGVLILESSFKKFS
jgi:hypothetical protein